MNQNSATTTLSSIRFSIHKDLPKIFIIALFYFFAHGISFFFPDSEKVIMLVWPAGGIGLAAFLLYPKKLWPLLTIAFYISGITADVFLAGRSFLTGIGFMTGNMVESIGCAWFILYWSTDFQKFTRVKEVIALITAAVIINALSSCIGAGISVLTRGVSFSESWRSWYIADGLGILLVGPFIITWIFNIKEFISGLNQKKIIEWLVFLFVWIIISILIFFKKDTSLGFHHYFLVALLIWPAIRLGIRGVSLALILLFVIAILSSSIINGPSPWMGTNSNFANRLLELQFFQAFLAIVGFLISAGYTGLKQTETALKQSEEQFRSTFEQVTVGMAHVKTDGKFLRVNQKLCDILGYSKEELLSKTFQDITYPDDLNVNVQYLHRILKNDIKSFSDEKRYITKDREVIWVNITVTAFQSTTDKLEYMITVIEDITEKKRVEEILKKSEEKFAKAFKISPEAIIIASMADGKYIEVNDVFLTTTGFSLDEVIGHTSDELNVWVTENDRLKYIKELSENGSLKNFEVQYRMKNNKVEDFLVSSSIFYLQGVKCSLNFIKNITERKNLENAILKSKKQYDTLVTNIPIGIFLLRTSIQNTYAFEYISPKIEEMLEVSAESILLNPQAAFHMFHPDDKDELVRLNQEHLRNLKPFDWEGRAVIKGSIKWLRISSYPEPLENGDVLWNGVITDITQPKLADELRFASELRYRRLFESAKDGILILDAETGKIVDVNPYLIEMLSYSKEQFIEKTIWDIGFFKDIVANQDNFLELQQKEYIRYEDLPLETAAGRKFHVEFVSNVYLVNDRKVIQCNIRDITERKRAEEDLNRQAALLQAQANSTIEGIIVVDPMGKKIFQNRRTIELWKIPQHIAENPDDSQQVQHVMSLTKDPERFVEKITYLYSHPDEITQDEVELTDGSVLDRYSAPVLDKEGKNYGRIWTFRDITERKRVENELEIYRKQLEDLVKIRTEELNNTNDELKIQVEKQKEFELILQQSLQKEKELSEMQSRFISTTSHEFRTPLTAVLSSTELLQRYSHKWSEEKKKEHFDRIIESVEYLTKLLDDILTISRTESGKISYKPESVNLYHLVSECANDNESLLTEKHEFRFNYNLEKKVFNLDRKLMKFIFSNLLSNAAKYSPEGGIIGLTINQNQQRLSIEISDEGIGIPPEEVNKIFDSFYRSKNTGVIEGTGLGLAIVKRAVELHNGEITVASELNKGTIFIVTIPIKVNA